MTWLNRDFMPGPYLALCTSQAQFNEARKDLGQLPGEWMGEKSAARTHNHEKPGGGTACIVCIRIAPDRHPCEVAGLLVHEAVHVFQYWCEGLGEDKPSAEFEAYTIQGISTRLMLAYSEILNPVGPKS
jgi:hypothetical protein